MRRTLLAVGIAVLLSMLFTPHEDFSSWTGTRYFPIFFVDIVNYHDINPILWGNLIGQTIFAAVLAAVLVNLRKRRTSE
jgi:hypothetical protein